MEKSKPRPWKVLRSEYVAREPWFTVRHECVELPGGAHVPDYYVFEYPAWVNVIAITRDALKSRGVKCAGLLATDGTVQTGIYQRTFEGSGVELLTPDNAEDQAAVMDIIYNGVKAGNLTHDATAFRTACEHLLARGAEVLILGCTELPPAFDIYHLDYPNVDPTLELALAAVRAAGCQTK